MKKVMTEKRWALLAALSFLLNMAALMASKIHADDAPPAGQGQAVGQQGQVGRYQIAAWGAGGHGYYIIDTTSGKVIKEWGN